MSAYNLITILGPTACGKTSVATRLAAKTEGEIISADSRQLYRGMDIGTGKDLNEYTVGGTAIPYHLIDIAAPGYKYNVYEFQRDFVHTYEDIQHRGKLPILCGGTGLYIEAVLKGYKLVEVPENPDLRQQLQDKTLPELEQILAGYIHLHNKTDVDTSKRAIRAIEIAEYYKTHDVNITDYPPIQSLIIGLDIEREERRKRISERLQKRMDEGMVDEVKNLLASGIKPEDLLYYGLEYKYLTLYCTGQLAYNNMLHELEIAIHQFAKRQMTWFRGMEKRGLKIHWIDALLPMEEKIGRIMDLMD
jgi:tRNA dimethylallyltransferase